MVILPVNQNSAEAWAEGKLSDAQLFLSPPGDCLFVTCIKSALDLRRVLAYVKGREVKMIFYTLTPAVVKLANRCVCTVKNHRYFVQGKYE